LGTPPKIVVTVLMRVNFPWPDDIDAKKVERPTRGNNAMVEYPLLERLTMMTMFLHDAYESFTDLGLIGIKLFRFHLDEDLTIDNPIIVRLYIAEKIIGGDIDIFISIPDVVFRDVADDNFGHPAKMNLWDGTKSTINHPSS
jgi:hypothetical protein